MAQATTEMINEAQESPPKNRVLINLSKCKGCQLCVVVCATGNLRIDNEQLNAKGYNPAVWSWKGTKANCTGCENCFWVCPDAAIQAVVTLPKVSA